MRLKHISTFSLFLFFTATTFLNGVLVAQSESKTITISINELIKLVSSDNLDLKALNLKNDIASADAALSNQWWLPKIEGGFSFHQLWGNAMNSDGRIFTEVNRQSFGGDAGIYSKWNLAEGIGNSKSANLKAQAIHSLSQSQKNETILGVIEEYYNFLAAQLSVSAYKGLNQQAKGIVDQIKIQVDAGLVYETDLLIAQSNLRQIQIDQISSESKLVESEAALKEALFLGTEYSLISIDTAFSAIELIKDDSTVDLNQVHDLRPEIKYRQLLTKSIDQQKRSYAASYLAPTIWFGAQSGIFGDVFSDIAPTSEINGGLIWIIPLDRLIGQKEMKKYDSELLLAKHQVEQEKNKINHQLAGLVQKLSLNKKQLTLAKEGVEISQKALSQSLQRLQLGTMRQYDLIQTQEIYIQARLNYYRALTTYNSTQFKTWVALGNSW